MKLYPVMAGLILLTGLAVSLPAAEVQGILMDRQCSMKALKEGQNAAVMHTRECNLMPESAKSGYGVFTADNKFICLDAAGNKRAAAALQATKKKDNLKVKVSGDVNGETIAVKSLKLQ
jgi:hypothetical protein